MNVKQTAFCIWSAYLGFYYMIGKVSEEELQKTEEIFNTMTQLISKGIEVN
jgi:hypothetical protein